MPGPPIPLDSIRVASPCSASWEGMGGTDRVRHCGSCRLNVYDLSSMTRPEAEDLLRRTEGRLCVRFFPRADGTVLTRDCPVGFRAVRRRLALLGSAVAAAFLGLLAAGCGRSSGEGGDSSPPRAVPASQPANPADPGGILGRVAPGGPEMGDVAGPVELLGEIHVPESPPK